jgi:ribosomal protein L7/L12
VILGVTKEPEFSTLKPAKELAERHYNKRGREIWRRQYERTAPTSRKIQMIKHLRSMTMLLGKLGIKSMVSEYPPNGPIIPRVYYGIGLKESKDVTEGYLKRIGRFELL